MTQDHGKWRRREVAAGLAGLAAGLTWPGAVRALVPTPAQTPGPFYPDAMPADTDNDLLRLVGSDRVALGDVLDLTGRVLDAGGAPIPDALVEIWQADARGRYLHSADARRGPSDPDFQGYGRATSGADGGYAFRTIRPVPYGARTPHIHFAVLAPGRPPLVTQMYVANEPRNATDGLYNRIRDPLRRAAVTVALSPAADGGLAGDFDIVLGG